MGSSLPTRREEIRQQGPPVVEQHSFAYLWVFRAENSSEVICFKKLKQKKKI